MLIQESFFPNYSYKNKKFNLLLENRSLQECRQKELPVPTTNRLIVYAPAKLNLFLEVLAKRPDQYHEIESIAVPVSLYDTLIFERNDRNALEFSCYTNPSDTSLSALPLNTSNLVIQAIMKLADYSSFFPNLKISLWKRIPTEAGLGGGSSDAAATLLAVNRLCDLQLDFSVLMSIAASLGSDVPLFLQEGATFSRGRGEIVERLEPFPRLDFVLFKPKKGLSTAAVYKECASFLPLPKRSPAPFLEWIRSFHGSNGNSSDRCLLNIDEFSDLNKHSKTVICEKDKNDSSIKKNSAVRKNCANGTIRTFDTQIFDCKSHWDSLPETFFFNRLEMAAERLWPEIVYYKELFLREGIRNVQMSGSGTCFFGLCRNPTEAKRIAGQLQRQRNGYVFAVHSCQ